MARALRVLGWVMGVACVAIGIEHVLIGAAALPGGSGADATTDSFSRFMGAIFAGYGAAWIWTVRQSPVPARAVRWLAGVFLLGGLSRILSVAVKGRPDGFQVALMVIELALGPVYLWLADADRRASANTG